jgi:hypothetical protein
MKTGRVFRNAAPHARSKAVKIEIEDVKTEAVSHEQAM